MPVIFITGIDTGVGKTVASGLLARYLYRQNKSVITQKLVQTGCENESEDIVTHRRIMGIELNADDKNGLSCPYIFKYPASPHLAAQLEQTSIDIKKIVSATTELSKKYDFVIVEGAGGIYVPLNEAITIIDYLKIYNYPVIIVTSSKLGSINHTLLTIEAVKQRNIKILGMIYNTYPEQKKEITEDSKKVFNIFLKKFGLNVPIIDIPYSGIDGLEEVNFDAFFNY